jgi:hypothetical protein
VRTVPDAESAAKIVLSPDFDPRVAAIVERNLEHWHPRRIKRGSAITPASDVRMPEPTRLEIDVDLARGGVLVLSESAYPGWQATLDGSPVEWFPVDLQLKGVEVPRGRHTVRFEYRPWSVDWGLWISGASLFAVLLLYASVFVGPWQKTASHVRK